MSESITRQMCRALDQSTCGNEQTLREIYMLQAKVTTIGNSVGIILPKEVMAKLRVKFG